MCARSGIVSDHYNYLSLVNEIHKGCQRERIKLRQLIGELGDCCNRLLQINILRSTNYISTKNKWIVAVIIPLLNQVKIVLQQLSLNSQLINFWMSPVFQHTPSSVLVVASTRATNDDKINISDNLFFTHFYEKSTCF